MVIWAEPVSPTCWIDPGVWGQHRANGVGRVHGGLTSGIAVRTSVNFALLHPLYIQRAPERLEKVKYK